MSHNNFEVLAEPFVVSDSGWYLYCLFAGVVVTVTWRFLAVGHRRVVDPLTATELACLSAMDRPLVAAMAQLRATGHIDSTGRATSTRPLPLWVDDFTRRTLSLLGKPTFSWRRLLREQLEPLRDLEASLAQRGYLYTEAERWRIRLGAVPLVLLSVIGFVVGLVLLARPDSGGSAAIARFLAPAVVTAIAVPIYFSLPGTGRVSRAGKRALAEESERASYLAPKLHPAFATYGPQALGLSIALFGTGALEQFDPELAALMTVMHESSEGPGGGDGTCGSWSGGPSHGGASSGGSSGCGGGGGTSDCGGCGGGGGGS